MRLIRGVMILSTAPSTPCTDHCTISIVKQATVLNICAIRTCAIPTSQPHGKAWRRASTVHAEVSAEIRDLRSLEAVLSTSG
ncbi:hypothetical protein BDW02DRAFT_573849 [Decorospora gaudefroyi]|uniref:Uncharacterized protein n=1 Tax=Decorospora gaudefroyi TaxID=184978 RepID=A0A6A5K504_9PLEO|nr:hypothetical protein BDW02DRAFT_573849 [Decorospora gaudefroyi]